MSETLDNFLSSLDKENKKEITFQRGLIGPKSVPLTYSKLPRQYRTYLDDFAVAALDPDGGRIIVTGSPQVGKTFFIDQLITNKDIFVERSGLSGLEFVNVTIDHARIVGSTGNKWFSYAENASRFYRVPFENLVFVTESLDAAVGLTGIGGRVILEASISTFQQLRQHEKSGMVKQWAAWEIIDLNDVYLSKNDLIEVLSQSLLDKLNKNFPHLDMTRKHITLFINMAVKRGELLIDPEMDKELAGYVCVQPGVFARALGRLASLMAISSEVRNSHGKLYFSRAMERTFSDFEPLFFACLEDFIDQKEGGAFGDESEVESTLRAMLEDIPGVKITSIRENDPRKERESKKKPAKALEFSDFSTLEQRLATSVLGQDEAIHEVVEGLKIPAAGLNLDNKPLRSMIFLGPTGVGKTQLALSLAQELMSEPLEVKRIDMSEFSQEHEAAKLLGAPPGYVGFDEGGVLTNFVKDNPTSLIILDEIEKAHPRIWDSFLQILDAGRMTDGRGETVDFSKTVLIMTSNIGADKLARRHSGFNTGSAQDRYKQRTLAATEVIHKSLEEIFRPELINRIDQQVVFHELPQEILRQVIAKELNMAGQRLSTRGFVLEKPRVEVLDYIASMADASKYGAREVQRVIGKNVYELLANSVLADKDKKGLKLRLSRGKLTVQTRAIGNENE